jgi:hypothetical protein
MKLGIMHLFRCQPAVELVQAADPAAPAQGRADILVEEKLGEAVSSVCEMGMPASDVSTEETRTSDHQQPGPCASSKSSRTVAEQNNSLGSKVSHVCYMNTYRTGNIWMFFFQHCF